MWPWQAFDWGVFWAIIAAGVIYLVIANIFSLFIVWLQEWGEKVP
jgi:ABC-type arginine transport system permease subunit